MTAIKKAREKRQELSKAKGLKVEHNLKQKYLANPSSRKLALHAFCFQCCGGTEDEMPDPGWKDFIRTCTDPSCPGYLNRPYR